MFSLVLLNLLDLLEAYNYETFLETFSLTKIRYYLIIYQNLDYFIDKALLLGDIRICSWLRQFIDSWNNTHLSLATKLGHIDLCYWLLCNGCTTHEHFFTDAIISGSQELCQFAYNTRKYSFSAKIFSLAAFYEHLHLCEWLYMHHCSWNEDTFHYAALSGSLELCQWLYMHHCPWNAKTFLYAVYSRSLELCQWLHTHHCPWNEEAFTAAVAYRLFPICSWLLQQHCPYDQIIYDHLQNNNFI